MSRQDTTAPADGQKQLRSDIRQLLADYESTCLGKSDHSFRRHYSGQGYLSVRGISEIHELEGGTIIYHFRDEGLGEIRIDTDEFRGVCDSMLVMSGWDENSTEFSQLTGDLESRLGQYFHNSLKVYEGTSIHNYDLSESMQYILMRYDLGSEHSFAVGREKLLRGLADMGVSYNVVAARLSIPSSYRWKAADWAERYAQRKGYIFHLQELPNIDLPFVGFDEVPGERLLEDRQFRLIYEIEPGLFPRYDQCTRKPATAVDITTGKQVSRSTFMLCESVSPERRGVVDYGFAHITYGAPYPQQESHMLELLELPFVLSRTKEL